jgi:hypothetical protein
MRFARLKARPKQAQRRCGIRFFYPHKVSFYGKAENRTEQLVRFPYYLLDRSFRSGQAVSSANGDLDVPTLDEHILRILGEATEALFASDIAERLNKELRPDSAYITVDVAKHLRGMTDQVAQLPDGRWMLKRLML